MTEEEFKSTINNFLMMQNNNDHNFKILQAQIDRLEKKIEGLNELRDWMRLPKPENMDRKPFDETD